MYASDLAPYFERKSGKTTPINYALHKILSHMIRDYANKNPDHIEKVNTTPSNYNAVVVIINENFLKISDENEWAINEKDLVRLCLPNKDPDKVEHIIEGNMSKQKISDIYRFFSSKNFDTLKRDGKFYILEYEASKNNRTPTAVELDYSNILKSASVITEYFRERIMEDSIHHDQVDFYLGIGECQWMGIYQTWDCKRGIVKEIKSKILNAHADNKKVAAVVYGGPGTGKTTCLRRVAVDLNQENYIVIWVDKFYDFITNELQFITQDIKTVLFIDDWTKIEGNSALVNKLFEKVGNSKYITLVIGDRKITDRQYSRYILPEECSKLLSVDNSEIIARVLAFKAEWSNVANQLLKSFEFLQNPIYLILFIISRYSGEKEFIKTENFKILFREIIQEDLRQIAELHIGLAVAFYYWSCIYQEYKHIENMMFLTWKAFMEIARHYSGGPFEVDHLSKLNTESEVYRILKRYISKTSFVNPDLEKVYYFRYHHDLLVEEGLSKCEIKLGRFPRYTNSIKLELFTILTDRGMVNSARDLALYLLQEGSEDKNFLIESNLGIHDLNVLFYRTNDEYFSISRLLEYDKLTKALYAERNVQVIINNIYKMIYQYGFTASSLFKIFKEISQSGSSSEYVQKGLDFIEGGKFRNFAELIKSKTTDRIEYIEMINKQVLFVELDNQEILVYKGLSITDDL